MSSGLRSKDVWLLLLFTSGAIVVHGYHPFVEDAEIYVPGIKKVLNPALYPFNTQFFSSHARLTLFPNLVAGSIKLMHVPFDWALLLWHFMCIFLLLSACWHLGRLAFADALGRWAGVALVASLLTLPVAGTALYVMDQYLNTRSLSTPAVMFIIVNALQRKLWRTGLWALATAAVHPLMAGFGISCAALILLLDRSRPTMPVRAEVICLLFPLRLLPPITDAYRQVLESRPYFFILQWEWYEWLGILGPFLLLWWFGRIAGRHNMWIMNVLCRATLLFGILFFVLALVITIPPSLASLAELQPMRSLHLLYIVMLVLTGGLLAEFALKKHLLRWLIFLPLCLGMAYAQRHLFPSTAHIEWPAAPAKNDWVKAFLWIRDNTPLDAYFALNPRHMRLPGEDQHGFRAIAERSMLADEVKDSGAVTMFPALAEIWQRQLRAQQGWQNFQAQDFLRLRREFGVTWVVLQRPGVPGLSCPYQNQTLLVCRIP